MPMHVAYDNREKPRPCCCSEFLSSLILAGRLWDSRRSANYEDEHTPPCLPSYDPRPALTCKCLKAETVQRTPKESPRTAAALRDARTMWTSHHLPGSKARPCQRLRDQITLSLHEFARSESQSFAVCNHQIRKQMNDLGFMSSEHRT